MSKGIDMTADFEPGITCVRVMRKDINEQTKREVIREVHQGIVIAKTSSFVRVFNPAPIDKGGDPSPEMAQLFPVAAPRTWVEVIGNRKPENRFPIPPTLR
jgi:hypothetical protein